MRKHEKEMHLNHINAQIEGMRKRANGLSEEDAAVLNETIDELTRYADEIKAAEEDMNIEDALKSLEDRINEKIDALNEKVTEQEKPEEEMQENYLKTENALHDFATALRSKNSMDAWQQSLSTNGIAITSGDEFGFLPEYVKGKIDDLLTKSFPWLTKINYVNAKAYAIRTEETAMDSTNPDNLGKGHKAGETKAENAYTMVAKSLTCQNLYAKIYVDNITAFNDEGLIDYVVDRLVRELNAATAKAILVGDGRSSGTPDLRIQAIESIARSSSDSFVTVATHVSGAELITEARATVDAIETYDGGEILLFASKADITEMETVTFGTGSSTQYQSAEVLAGQLGCTEVIACPWLGSAKTYRMIAFDPSKYVMIGEPSIKIDNWENYDKNQHGFRAERACAGAVEGLKSAAVLKS